MDFDHLDPRTPGDRDRLIEALAQLAPTCFTEALDAKTQTLRRAVNLDALSDLLGEAAVEATRDELYQFTWPGKQAARWNAAAPTDAMLRPAPEESVDWAATRNLYIEGDNLTVLKLLQRGYAGRVQMVYIDPPYNTGSDFVYRDEWKADLDAFEEDSGVRDAVGVRYRRNSDTSGRFHSDWCSMIYSRLLVARSLLAADGVIFISIDDNEAHNLRKICDEVFGSENFVAELPTIMNLKGNQDQFGFAGTHEYTLVYAKNRNALTLNEFSIDEEEIEGSWQIDAKGYYKQGAGLVSTGVNSPREHRPKLWFPVFVKDGAISVPPDEVISRFYNPQTKAFNDDLLSSYIADQESSGAGKALLPIVKGRAARWRWGAERLRREADEIIVVGSKSGYALYKKQRPGLADLPSRKPKSLFYKPEYSSGNGTFEIEKLFNAERYFSNPKPLRLIQDFLQIGSSPDALILDFFSGSGTTAHAVMQLNAEDGGRRRYICVQLDEPTPEGSAARRAGFDSIPAIAKERIRRAGRAIRAEAPLAAAGVDVGFRVLRVDSANFVEARRPADEYAQRTLDALVDNLKPDRTDLDLLFGALLAWGLELSLPVRAVEAAGGARLYVVGEGELAACFAARVTEAVAEAIAALRPARVLFRDDSFADDTAKINVFERLKQRLGWDSREAMQRIKVL